MNNNKIAQPSQNTKAAPGVFNNNIYHIEEQFTLIKEKFKIQDGAGNTLLWVTTPTLALKKEFHIFSDEACTQEVLDIKMHGIVNFSDKWDVTDKSTNTLIGTIKQKINLTLKWELLNDKGEAMANVGEELKDLLVGQIGIPKKFNLTHNNGSIMGTYSQELSMTMLKFDLDFNSDTEILIDRRLGIALGLIIVDKIISQNNQMQENNI
jgi:uncharacterized protein YxjI